MSAYLTIEFTAGDDIGSAFKEAVDIADRLKIRVQFNFNGCLCLVSPGGDPEKGKLEFFKSIGSKHQIATT